MCYDGYADFAYIRLSHICWWVQTIHTKCHNRLVKILISERKRAGITQIELAKSLGHSQTWVARLEAGGRRIDVVEFLALADRIGFDPAEVVRSLGKNFSR